MSILLTLILQNPFLLKPSEEFNQWHLVQMGNYWLQEQSMVRSGCCKLLVAHHSLPFRDTLIEYGQWLSGPMTTSLPVAVRTRLYACGRSALDAVSTPCKDIQIGYGVSLSVPMANSLSLVVRIRRYGCGRLALENASRPCMNIPILYDRSLSV